MDKKDLPAGMEWVLSMPRAAIDELLNALEPFALVGLNPDPTNPPADCYLKAAEVWSKYHADND